MTIYQSIIPQTINQPPNKFTYHNNYTAYLTLIIYFFLIPKIFQYSWPYLITNYSQAFIYCLIGNFISWLFHACGHLYFYFVYNKIIDYQQYRCYPDKKWPWESNQQEWKKLFKKSIKLMIFNYYLFTPLLTYLQAKYLGVIYTSDLNSFPTFSTLFIQFLFFQMVESPTNYFFHSLFHRYESLYKIAHKTHHQYKVSVTISAQHQTPIEYIFVNVLPTVLGPFLLATLGVKVHLVSFFMFQIYKVVQNIDQHCGYVLPFSPWRLFRLGVTGFYHSFHHYYNAGNFDSIIAMGDTIFKTNVQFKKYIKELNQHNKKL